MAAKHPVSGRVSEEVASAIDIALAETSDALQINEESWLWALTHHSRGAAAGPSGLTMECWKDVCADPNISASLLAFVNATFCRAKLPPALVHLWGSCNTAGLTKKDGGLHPISMGETLRRGASRGKPPHTNCASPPAPTFGLSNGASTRAAVARPSPTPHAAICAVTQLTCC